MSTTKHKPGEENFYLRPDDPKNMDNQTVIWVKSSYSNYRVAVVYGETNEQSMRRAKMLSASYDLLKALEELVDKCIRTQADYHVAEEIMNAQLAINKATA